MAVSNPFVREVSANKSPRNAFNVGYSTLFSSPAGQLLPCYYEQVDKGDKLKLGVNNITRTAPVQTSAFMTFDEKVDFWFVPMRLIWSDWDNWRIGQSYRHRTTELSNPGNQYLLPFARYVDIVNFLGSITVGSSSTNELGFFNRPNVPDTLRLLDLLGYSVPRSEILSSVKGTDTLSTSTPLLEEVIDTYYGSLSPVLPFNYFNLCAFQCIYMHGYRNEEYEQLDPSYYNVDNLFPNLKTANTPYSSTSVLGTYSTNTFLVSGSSGEPTGPLEDRLTCAKLFQPRFKNWRADVFTSLKPSSGFDSNTGINWPRVASNGLGHFTGSDFVWPSVGAASTGAPNNNSYYNPTRTDSTSSNSPANNFSFYQTPDQVYQALKVTVGNDSTGTAYLYPQQIRNLMSQDKFVRSSIYARKNLSAQMKALFGDDYSDHHAPRYLGSYSSNIQITDVTATGAGEAGSASSILGQVAGKGLNTDNKGTVFEHTFDCDGIVMGIHYVMPRNNYDSYRINKLNTKVSRWDYFYPQFDGLGLQPVFQFERSIPDSAALIAKCGTLLGYAPRFYEYKQRTNEVHGAFMDGQADRAWTLSNNGTAVTSASDARNYKILPNITDRIFERNYDGSLVSDPFYHYYYFDVTRVTNKEVYGTPSV